MKIPLRERKAARTRLRLAEILRQRLEQMPFEALAVRDLCQAAEIAEATFFNYFPRKQDLLAYAGRLLALDLNWGVTRAAETSPGLAAIQGLFEQAAREAAAAPGFVGELIAYQARLRERPDPEPLPRADRLLAFPDRPGIDALEDAGIDALIARELRHAVDRGELPPNAHLPTLVVGLVALFNGVIIALRLVNPQGIAAMYRQQLALFRAGARAASQRPLQS
ncbi:TetR/AcrR family transcriptional regulator [Thiohalobacter sp.]|uniref:TetR/AcrR family transcriptional regulator n=1 Tax=Thiohalobacter sp. TaxID=2025948 RepID=UPI00261F84B3|nr:TetR family transcriptional regulator [Thiohalobacter sp.]